MAYAITPGCCADASCVAVCPVDCIHPTPDEVEFGQTDMLYVDPATCIDCGACADACPVDAIHPSDLLTGTASRYVEVNRDFYRTRPPTVRGVRTFPRAAGTATGELRVAIIGAGPAAWYAADVLLRTVGARVTILDRLPHAGGLLRYGVAPDHPETRRLSSRFEGLARHPRLTTMLGVEVGRDVSVEDVARHHHAVLFATGASEGRTLGIPGEDLPGSLSAADVVAWYNGRPDRRPKPIDLGTERAVIVGTGNVAVDIARILTADPDSLADTEIAPEALAQLRQSRIREVVLVGRRGPDTAAYTAGELHALVDAPGVSLVEDSGAGTPSAARSDATAPTAVGSAKAALLEGLDHQEVDWSMPPPDGRRVVLRFWSRPEQVEGTDRVEGITLRSTLPDADESSALRLPTGLVVCSIGFRGLPLVGLPFDEATGTIPNVAGAVRAPAGEPVPGSYVVGWMKRGPTGGLGANRVDAAETVATLVEDALAGQLPEPTGSARAFAALVRRRRSSTARKLPLSATLSASEDPSVRA